MFKIGRKRTGIEEIKNILLQKKSKRPQDVRKALSRLSMEESWELVKTTLPELDKSDARDIVRFLFPGNPAFFKDRLFDENDKYLAIECLGYLPSKETVKILVELLRHKDGNIQLCAAGALKHHTPRLVVPYLIKAMLHDAVLPARAGEVLLAMGYLAQESILEVYPLALPRVRVSFLELLVQAENPKCEPFVAQALKSNNSELITKALEAVTLFGFSDLWPEVVTCLAESSWIVRSKALNVLEKLKIPDTRRYIVPLLQDEEDWVRNCAQDCLKAIDDVITEKGYESAAKQQCLSNSMEKGGNMGHFYLGDIVKMRKKHPCGGDEWEVLRTGMDFRIKCLRCSRQVWLDRASFEKAVKKIIKRGPEAPDQGS